MPSATTINLQVQPVRLLDQASAAHYCGFRNVKTFEAQCPVPPIRMGKGGRVWDVHDLDKWIDRLKPGDDFDDADILARLA